MKVYTVSTDGTPYYSGTSGGITYNVNSSGVITNSNSAAVTGTAGFPTWNFNHTPAAVAHTYYIPTTPVLSSSFTPLGLSDDFGVALDGIPFDPLTSTCGTTSQATANKCSYRLEGRLQVTPSTPSSSYTTLRLGFDVHNGHSQSNPNAYHYHGIPCGIVASAGASPLIACNPMSTSNTWSNLPSTPVVVGYARDGYPMVVQNGVYSSYSVVTSASSGRTVAVSTSYPLGSFSADMTTLGTTGTSFTATNLPTNTVLGDFKYTGPSGYGTSTSALGRCNEAPNTTSTIKTLDGQQAAYVYYVTPNFPMIPRCLIGNTDGPTTTTQGFYHYSANSSD
ncbi:MAG: YHYH protein [Magnetococcales bacterium]|nr:YHYH protein [Magnetococcales bacterium]